MHEIAEHTHYVQGVAWDPMNEFIATQSSDRSMHVYSIANKHGSFEVHAVGKNTRVPHNHTRTPSSQSRTSSRSRPQLQRQQSITSEAESSISELPLEALPSSATLSPSVSHYGSSFGGNITPATSVASTPVTTAAMFPPPMEKANSSRRSSFSAPGSPAHPGRYGRSPSPMPALPAIRPLPNAIAAWNSVKLYGDESFSNFFRRLTFSPDGGLLLTPAGQFEDPAFTPGIKAAVKTEETGRGRKGRGAAPAAAEIANPSSTSSVFIYSRANFARPPIAQLPGHKKASVAVRFSPILYELRHGVVGADAATEPKTVFVDKGKEENVAVDVTGPDPPTLSSGLGLSTDLRSPSQGTPLPTPISATMPSPALSAADSIRPATPARHATSSTPIQTGSVFALPYRMLFAVATMDTIAIHDTQQAGPLCLLTKLHYDEFTDMTW